MTSITSTTILTQSKSELNKLSGHDFYKSIGSPKYVVAPMVDASELAWRVLSRLHGATLAYTPMFHAQLFATEGQPKYFNESFDTSPDSLEGVAPFDRPLVVQFCANDKDIWLKAAQKVVGRCDAVDLNLGCPQGIAKKGHYGAFLMDEWELVGNMISHLHANLALPVIAKIRVFPALEKTLSYASHIYSSGAQLLTVHGRIREAKGQMAGLADWTKIQAVTSILGSKVPILANGGLPSGEEIETCLEETGANGVMSAEGNLYNPMIFSPLNAKGGREYKLCLPLEMQTALNLCEEELVGTWNKDLMAYAPATYLANQYLSIVETLPSTETSSSAVKSHLFKLFRPIWATGRHVDLRESLSNCGVTNHLASKLSRKERIGEVRKFVDEFRRRIKADTEAGFLPPNINRPLTHAEVLKDFDGVIPYSHCQPYLRVKDPSDSIPLNSIGIKRAHSPSPNSTIDPVSSTSTSTSLPLPSETKKTKVYEEHLACINISATPRCINAPSVKCVHGACSACCVSLSLPLSSTSTNSSTSTSTRKEILTQGQSCEFHLLKTSRELEKNLLKKNLTKEKKRLHKERNELMQIEAEKKREIKKAEKALVHLARLEENGRRRLEESLRLEVEGKIVVEGEKVEVESQVVDGVEGFIEENKV